mgnify:CR=1 FL=1
MGKIYMSSSRADVKDFLSQMNSIFSSDGFNIDRDFVFQRIREQDEPDDEFTNENTMLELDYDTEDVVEELKSLSIEDYSESIVDNVADGFKIFYVFGKQISEHDVYIKVRIKQRGRTADDFVFCVSFHFARHPITVYPYKRKA